MKLKKFFHNFFRVILIILIAILVLTLLIIGILYYNHRTKLDDERGYLTPPGTFVNVGEHKLHIRMEGKQDAEHTLVFVHGRGVPDEAIALEPLFAELKDEYRMVLVDRAGFGYSDDKVSAKDIASILEEERGALLAAGVKGPYDIVAQGEGGLIALYWAETYPEEVSSIIGVNMLFPEDFEGVTQEKYAGFFYYIMAKGSGIGLHRLMKHLYPVNVGAVYTEKQMAIRKALYSEGFYTEAMYEEDLETIDNAAKVADKGVPEKLPILELLANPLMEPYITDDAQMAEDYAEAKQEAGETDIDFAAELNRERRDFLKNYKNVTVKELSGPARLYTYCPKDVADAIREFLKQ